MLKEFGRWVGEEGKEDGGGGGGEGRWLGGATMKMVLLETVPSALTGKQKVSK